MLRFSLTILLTICCTLLIAGCETYGGTGSSQNSLIAVEYGTVQSIQRAEVDAKVGQGAAVGGLAGLAVAAGTGGSTGQQLGGAALGALLGGLVQSQRAANNKSEQYTVRLTSGRTVAIVTEHHSIVIGDCVAVEQGRHANIRRVSPVMCNSMADASNPAYGEVHQANVEEASECEEAKQGVLAATSEAEVNVAYQKMRALCEH